MGQARCSAFDSITLPHRRKGATCLSQGTIKVRIAGLSNLRLIQHARPMEIIGESIGSIYTQLQERPHVIERERVNFEYLPEELLVESEIGKGAPAVP